jgi:Glutamate-cysteine ligase family 2(GCS2)
MVFLLTPWTQPTTCIGCLQVNLDFSDEADMVQMARLGIALQPIATALFANSPFRDGKPTGYLSWRSHVWTDTVSIFSACWDRDPSDTAAATLRVWLYRQVGSRSAPIQSCLACTAHGSRPQTFMYVARCPAIMAAHVFYRRPDRSTPASCLTVRRGISLASCVDQCELTAQDPDRCGILPFVFDDDFGFARYAEFALDVPMYFVSRWAAVCCISAIVSAQRWAFETTLLFSKTVCQVPLAWHSTDARAC